MRPPEEIIAEVAKRPDDPSKLLEHINLLDEKLTELISVVDSQGSDVLQLIVFNSAFKSLLLEKELVTPEDLQQSLLEAAELIRQQMSQTEQPGSDESVDEDIEV
jgi:hypothetical protein